MAVGTRRRIPVASALLRSKTFRRAYAGIFVALVGVLALTQGAAWIRGDSATTDRVSPSRGLLSGGGEIIPGFSGECGSHKQASWESDSGAIPHVILVVYLFLGIAIICDEQFTSSLESICNPRTGLGLSPDVAGATFMAAGSSAPELASSFMGTFVSKSDVGLGTIIGSAVFNILIIIGATAIVVGEPMQLDWKPLGRDVCFYLGCVIILITFVAGDNKIELYEAILLLVYYALYIAFMTRNTQIMRWVAKNFGGEAPKSKSRRPSFSTGTWHHEKEDDKSAKYAPTEGSNDAGAAAGASTGSGSGAAVPPEMEGLEPLPGTPVPDMGQHLELPEIASAPGFGQGSGDGADPEAALPNTPMAPPTMGSDPAKGGPPSLPTGEADKEEAKEEGSGGGGGEEEEEEEGPLDKVLAVLSLPYELAFNYTMPDCKYEDPSDEEADEAIEELEKERPSADAGRAKEIDDEIASLNKQKALRAEIEAAEEAEEDEQAAKLQQQLFDMYEPLSWEQKAYLFTFSVSLVWITILSYFMVTLMEKIGCAWGISSFIMGITFLAMGTSVPDALGSIAVAKEGEGDMAVSNAIGSNVFDICIGLGLPYMIKTAIEGEGLEIKAKTESIIASAAILFLVVVVLFVSLWTATHPDTGERFCLYPVVGYILFASYGAFVIFQISWTAAGLD